MSRKHKDSNWRLNEDSNGNVTQADAELSVQMDIRDALLRQATALEAILGLLQCSRIPRALDSISRLDMRLRKHGFKIR